MSRRHLGTTILLASFTTAFAAQVALAGSADAATTPAAGLTVTKAELRGTQLRLEGRSLPGSEFVSVESTTSAVGARPGVSGVFKAQSDTFTAPDCRVVVKDFRNPAVTVALTGCTPSAKPVPANPAPPTGSCVISPVPAATLTVNQGSVVNFSTTGCTTSSVLTWTVAAGVIPTGMSGPNFQGSTAGNISGTPTVSGSYRFTVQVTDETGATDQENVSVTVT